jgi:hypothetical protein
MILVPVAAAVAVGAMVLLDLLNLGRSELDPVAHMVSFFVHERAGWLVAVVGVAAAVGAFALAPKVRPRGGVLVFGVGLLIAGLVPTQPYGQWDTFGTATLVHGIGGWAAFVALPVAAWRLRRDVPVWPGAVAGVLVGLLAIATLDAMDGPDHLGLLGGLIERLMVVAELGWLVLASRTVRRS